MILFLKDLKRGAGYLPGYGNHPGTGLMFFFIFLGGLAGLDRSWGFLGGASFIALVVLPLWILGCVSRARAWDRSEFNKG